MTSLTRLRCVCGARIEAEGEQLLSAVEIHLSKAHPASVAPEPGQRVWVSTISQRAASSDADGMSESTTTTYLVEVRPRSADAAETMAARARGASGPVRLLRSIHVPEDDRWFLLYEGGSTSDVTRAAERADVRVVSVAVATVANAKGEK